MVKADFKRDYYKDLELPSTADSEEIKRQFRILAKQYHPDRNPGREVEVVPKFQAVQAAHEVLSDPVEKLRYDNGRARLAAKHAATRNPDPYSFAAPPGSKSATASPAFPFPPHKQRGQSQAQRPGLNKASPAQSYSSTGPEKFNAFTRAPQSWDRTRFEDARAEAARVFPSMRPPTAPQMPPRPGRTAPTAPKSASASDMPNVPNVPPSSFAGMSRTAGARAPGYQAAAVGHDPQTIRSAYSHVRGADRPKGYTHAHHDGRSPPSFVRARAEASPLRHTKSSDYPVKDEAGIGSRPPSRYAGTSGERTDLHGDGLHRSASVRNSPIDPQVADDRGPFGRSHARFAQGPRHRSESPGRRAGGIHAEFSSDTSSSGDDTLNMGARPKAAPRTRPKFNTGPSFTAFADNDPALTGQFPSTNYTKVIDETRYHYPPPPDPRESQPPPPSPRDSQLPPQPSQEASPAHARPVGGDPDGPNPDPSQSHGPQSTFSAAEWQDNITADDIFRPGDSQMRKSPSKSSRVPKTPARPRGLSTQAHDASAGEMGTPLEEQGDASTDKATDTAAAFKQGTLPDDWASKVKVPSQHEPPEAAKRPTDESDASETSKEHYVMVEEEEEDAMDVDESPPLRPTTQDAQQSNGVRDGDSRTSSKRQSANGGVSLREFAHHAPFAPTSIGLQDLGDMATHLPFDSRAEPTHDPAAGTRHTARLRALNLPQPPKIVTPPAADRLDQTNFLRYVDHMNDYMREWNAFNAKMIEHFRHRQDWVCGNMSQNWISMLGDGPSADQLDENSAHHRAGYGAYMQWLKDDAQCRDWWEHAHERHVQCLEDLGETRKLAKKKFRPA